MWEGFFFSSTVGQAHTQGTASTITLDYMGIGSKAWLWVVAHKSISILSAVVLIGAAAALAAEVSAHSTPPEQSAYVEALEPEDTPNPTPTSTGDEEEEAPLAPPVQDKQAPRGADFIIDAPTQPSDFRPSADSGFVYHPAAIVNVTAADIPAWIQYDSAYDNERDGETEESWNSSLYGFYNVKYDQTYQYNPIEVHTHWWGDPATSPSHDEIVNYIANRDALTVNFVVSADRVTNMLPLTWMGTTTGYRNPWAWKMEIDPRLGDEVYKTVGALMYIVETKNSRLANEPIRLHKEFAETDCADIDTVYVREWVNKFASGQYDITTGQPAVNPPPVPVPSASSSPSQAPSSSPSASAG
jgi:hypothetical protein